MIFSPSARCSSFSCSKVNWGNLDSSPLANEFAVYPRPSKRTSRSDQNPAHGSRPSVRLAIRSTPKNAPHPNVPRARFATSFAMISSAPGSVCGRPSTAGGQARSQSPAPFAEPPSPCVFRAFATWATGVFALECALSSGTSSLVQGLRTGVFFFCISFRPILAGRCNIVAHQAQPNARILRVRSGCHLHRERHRHCSLRLRPAGAVIGRNCRPQREQVGRRVPRHHRQQDAPWDRRSCVSAERQSLIVWIPMSPRRGGLSPGARRARRSLVKDRLQRHPSHVALAAASATATASCAWQPLVLRRPLN